jgi:hypothetical protein
MGLFSLLNFDHDGREVMDVAYLDGNDPLGVVIVVSRSSGSNTVDSGQYVLEATKANKHNSA